MWSHYIHTQIFLADIDIFFGQCETQLSDQNTNAILASILILLRKKLIGGFGKQNMLPHKEIKLEQCPEKLKCQGPGKINISLLVCII